MNLAPYIYLKQTRFADASQHFATLMENAPAGIAYGNAQKSALESIGYKFVFTDSNIEPTQTDFSADAQAMKSAGAQGLIFNAVGPLYADVAKAMQNAGLKMPFATYNTNTYDPVYIPDAGSAANGSVLIQYIAMFQGEDAAAVPTIALFDKWYRALYNAVPDEFAAWGWLSGMLFVDGLNAGGGLSRANLLNGLRSVTSFDGGGMAAQDNPAGKKPSACYLIVDVVNEKYVRDPADPATGFACMDAPNFYYANG
jgi:ABC-type branched-subunit amino acid transport system substrate-binding protein